MLANYSVLFYLASNWNDDNGAVGPLSRKSFLLHEELSKELSHEIDYRRLNTLSVRAKSDPKGCEKQTIKANENKIPEWLDSESSIILGTSSIGDKKTTAQVNT